MFDKKSYWKNRKAGKRGQGVIEQKVTPKGEPLFYTTREGEKKEYPNAAGGHRAFSSRGGIIALNRKESRRKNVDRTYTASNYEAKMEQRDSNGNKIHSPHKYDPTKDPHNEKFVHPEPIYAPNLTNNQRMKLRDIRRMELREQRLQTV